MKSTGLGQLVVGIVVHAHLADGRAARSDHSSTASARSTTAISPSSATAGLDGLALVEPLREHVDGLVQMVDGHLEAGAAQAAGQGSDALPLVHLALDDVLDGAEGALEALGQRRPLLGLDLAFDIIICEQSQADMRRRSELSGN